MRSPRVSAIPPLVGVERTSVGGYSLVHRLALPRRCPLQLLDRPDDGSPVRDALDVTGREQLVGSDASLDRGVGAVPLTSNCAARQSSPRHRRDVNSAAKLVGSEDLYANLCDALASDAQLPAGIGGQINDAAVDEGTTILDSDLDCAAIFEVGHAHDRAEGERSMGRGHRPHIESCTIRHPATLVLSAIPGCQPGLDEARLLDGRGRHRSA